MSRILVLGEDDRVVSSKHLARANRMVALGQALWTDDHRAVRLTGEGEPGHGQTHTARGGLLGAIGRGQHYTHEDHTGRVTGFKTIWPKDRGLFHLATLECMAK